MLSIPIFAWTLSRTLRWIQLLLSLPAHFPNSVGSYSTRKSIAWHGMQANCVLLAWPSWKTEAKADLGGCAISSLDMRPPSPSIPEKEFLQNALAQSLRLDGRLPLELRTPSFEFGPELGYVECSMGKTRWVSSASNTTAYTDWRICFESSCACFCSDGQACSWKALRRDDDHTLRNFTHGFIWIRDWQVRGRVLLLFLEQCLTRWAGHLKKRLLLHGCWTRFYVGQMQ